MFQYTKKLILIILGTYIHQRQIFIKANHSYLLISISALFSQFF